jgi:hypothetical protein
MGLAIELKLEWVKKDGECQTCIVCEDIIYGKRYNLELTAGQNVTETKVNICAPCYDKSMENETR